MTTELNDENCGQLVIETDDELVDCSPSAPDVKTEFSSTAESSLKVDGIKANVKNSAYVDSSTCQSQSEIPDSTQISSNEAKMDSFNIEVDEHNCNDDEKLKSISTRNKKREKTSKIKTPDKQPLKKSGTPKSNLHGVHNFFGGACLNKKTMIDKSTCVFTRTNGMSSGLDENLLSMRPGTNLTIDITIICKSGGNTLYICAKWRGQEYHGILTDGEPLYSNHFSQKRNASTACSKSNFDNDGSGTSHNITMDGERSSNAGGTKRGGKRGGAHLSKPTIAANGPEDKRLKNIVDDTVGRQTDSNKQNVSSKSCSEPTTPGPISNEQSSSTFFTPHSSTHSPVSTLSSNPSNFHNQIVKRRISSDSSSSQHNHHGLYEASKRALPYRCPHRQCGFRFETIPDLNTHLLIHQGSERTKAAILESSATQTISPEINSIGCDPLYFSQEYNEKNSSPKILCFKCKQLLTKEEKEDIKNCQSKIISPSNLLKSVANVNEEEGSSSPIKKQRLQKIKENNNDNSPIFSDISDDTAPTLEKQEQLFDKQNDVQQVSTFSANKKCLEIPFTTTDIASTSLTTSNIFFPPSDGQLIDSATALYLQQLKNENNDKILLDKPSSFSSQSMNIVSNENVEAKTLNDLNKEKSQQQQNFNDSFQFSVSSNLDSNQLEISSSATAAMFGQQNPFTISQIQAIVDSNQQPSLPPKFLNDPSSAGLLSMGTPMCSTTAKLDVNTQIHHKIYELQEHASTSFSGGEQLGDDVQITAPIASRSSSTKPLQSQIGSTISPIPTMRPNSAIASGGGNNIQQNQRGGQNEQTNTQQTSHQQQYLQKSQQLPTTLHASNAFFLRPPSNPGMAFLPSIPNFASPSINPISSVQQPINSAAFFALQQQMALAQQQQAVTMRRHSNSGPQLSIASSSGIGPIQQSQMQQQLPTSSMYAQQPFGGQLQLPPGFLAAAASGIDLNMLQQYAALMNANQATGGSQHTNSPHIQQQNQK